MSKMVLFEDAGFANLLPTAYWRSVPELRCGGVTLSERAAAACQIPITGVWTRAWIADVAGARLGVEPNKPVSAGDVLMNSRWIGESPLSFPGAPVVATCGNAIAYVVCDEQLAGRLGPEDFLNREAWSDVLDEAPRVPVGGTMIEYPWELVAQSAEHIAQDWCASEAGVKGDVHASSTLVNPARIRIEAGARVLPQAVIDATDGPVTIADGATINSFSCIKGPVHIGPGSVINPHAYIHGGTSIGPVCKVGGEVDGCVFQGYSNKQHDGFLGHSYVGSWVNIGAGAVNSDLKNTYGTVRVPINGVDVDSGLSFFGAVIGDHTKIGINQTIPTGTMIGFGCNLACGAMLPRSVRSFSWLTDGGLREGDVERLVETAAKVMNRRNVAISDAERALFLKLPGMVAFFEPTSWDAPGAVGARHTDVSRVPMPQTEGQVR